ncbi:MAG: DUF3822 family protein [Bacteroidetes bacterium]|nr:DUF3822 family protein [Bacteroidota bacterium]
MRDLFLTQSGYAKNTNAQQNVAIAIRNNGFSFIIRTQPNAIAALGYVSISTINVAEYEQALREFLRHNLLQQSFDTCTIVYCNQAVSIIPKEFYSAETVREIFTLTQPCSENESVESYQLKNNDTIILYALPQNIVAICNKELKTTCKFYPQAAPFIEKSLVRHAAIDAFYGEMLNQKHGNNAGEKMLYISVESYHFDILVTNGGKLDLYNNFSFRTVNDFVYSVLNVCQQLQLNPQTTNIVLSGKISENSNYCQALQTFAPHAHVENPAHSNCDFPFNPIYYSVFSNLISTELCE